MKPLLSATFLVLAALLPPEAAWAQSSVDASVQGNDNNVAINQLSALDSTVNVEQIGVSNEISVVQSDANSDVDIVSDGITNNLSIDQSGIGAKRVNAQISGNDQIAAISQSGIDGNELTLVQNGAFNRTSIAQNNPGGIVNFINLLQSGVNNVANLEQNGAGNAIDLSQTGDDNTAAITQLGDGFAIAISQTGGATVAITQTGP